MKCVMICLIRFILGVKLITLSMQRIKDLLVSDPWGCSDSIYDSWMRHVMGCDLVCAHQTWLVTSMRCLEKVVIYVGCWMLGQSYDSCGMLGFRFDLVGMLRSLLWLVSFEPIYFDTKFFFIYYCYFSTTISAYCISRTNFITRTIE